MSVMNPGLDEVSMILSVCLSAACFGLFQVVGEVRGMLYASDTVLGERISSEE